MEEMLGSEYYEDKDRSWLTLDLERSRLKCSEKHPCGNLFHKMAASGEKAAWNSLLPLKHGSNEGNLTLEVTCILAVNVWTGRTK